MLYLLNKAVDTKDPMLGVAHQYEIKDIEKFLYLIQSIDISQPDIDDYLKKAITNKDLAKNEQTMYQMMIDRELSYFQILQQVHLKETGQVPFNELEVEDKIFVTYYHMVLELYQFTFPDLDENVRLIIGNNNLSLEGFSEREITIFDVITNDDEFKDLNNLIRNLNGWEYDEPHHDPILRMQQEKMKLHKAKFAPNVTLGSMWSTVAVGTGYTPKEMSELTLKQFFELYGRVSKFKEYDFSIIASVFGGKLSSFSEELEKVDDTHMNINLDDNDIQNINNQKSKKDK